ncbi:Electron transfer flavoprotein alpha subunit [Catenulispora acidiphila DSM 44928]|uniref:Electron transfer flavoprotein alpha subunit n=1 Tax=Catenulispora acidiphila (strain DSM 44928 / JCM 14897 / NBRC 102108 / NRRL B-24433 / ID139908) TaxID=479433 RepID=C7PVZ9_CATAD|nr:electron transfer flavoprotein subunit alpha/FixB family protein [Catenulispora acidiphila]ACU71391.1 Electron transfer flavoprotein alpha subunit [Catenulispora acidiphila DSM 44928]
MAHVVALVEHDAREGTVARSTCALLTLARRLGQPVAACATAPDEETIAVLGRYGATEIWCPDGPAGDAATALPLQRGAAEPAHANAGAGAGAGGDASAGASAGRSVGGDISAGRGIDASASASASAGRSAGGDIGAGRGIDASASASASASAGAGRDVIAGASLSDTDLLAAIAHSLTPAAILIAATHRGQETAARLAIRLDSGIITDAVEVRPGARGPIAVQRCLADSHLVESSVVRGIPIITVCPEAAVPEPSPSEPVLHTVAVEPSPARTPRIVATLKPRPARPALDHADIVVAGGRGIGSQAAFAVLADVAAALGAAVAGSHTAADLGWIPPEARVGLTGKTVNPRLYLACGVSGSVRHRAGMQGAKTVVAIGDDPSAPIFKLADLAVVGDARAILPALLAEILSRTQLRSQT